jgi:hypothetical protein
MDEAEAEGLDSYTTVEIPVDTADDPIPREPAGSLDGVQREGGGGILDSIVSTRQAK